MRNVEAAPVCSRPEPTRTESPIRALTFDGDPGFQRVLRERVAAYFATTGQRPRDCWQVYAKTAILLGSFAGLYALLVFGARTWVEGVPLAILLGLCAAGIGLNIQHDGGHRAYSSAPWVNRLMAMTLELIGGSSYLWRWKHGVFHHTYVNITGHDTDIELGYLGAARPAAEAAGVSSLAAPLSVAALRAPDHQVAVPRRLSGSSLRGRINEHRVPRPTGWELVIFIGGKAVFFALAFGIPMLFHAPAVVLGYYALSGIVMGFLLSVVFQVAHCVEEAEFPAPRPAPGASITHGPSIKPRRAWISRAGAGSCRGFSGASISRSSTTCSPGSATSTTRRSRGW